MVKNQALASKNGHLCKDTVGAQCQECSQPVEAIDFSLCFYCLGVLCWVCWDKHCGVCDGCFRQEIRERRKSEAIAAASPLPLIGRPKVMGICRYCGELFSARTMRKHRPKCRDSHSASPIEESWSDNA